MGLFECNIIGVNLFCDDIKFYEEILNKGFANMSVYNLIDIDRKAENSNTDNIWDDIWDEIDEDEVCYLDEDKIESILGERFKVELSKWDICNNENICFATSKEEFITLKDFNGYLICLEEAYVKGIRNQQIVVKSREDALNIIYCMYFTFSSYHIFPCDIAMAMTDGFNIIVDKICIKNIDNYRIIYWLYRNRGSKDKEVAAFLITNDKKIRSRSATEIYDGLNELLKYDETLLYMSNKEKDYNAVSLYTLELGKISEKTCI